MPEVVPNGKCKIQFIPDDVEITVDRGTILLDAAIAGGVHIAASCGGSGVCGTCKVSVLSGEVTSTRTKMLSAEEYQKGIRQACQSLVLTDLVVSVPQESKLEKAVQSREIKETSGISAVGWRYDPPLGKYYLELPPPTLKDNVSDLSRVMRGMQQNYNFCDISIDFEVLRKLPEVLREAQWCVTVTTLTEGIKPGNPGGPQARIINVEPGNTLGKHYALAIDVGTTTVCGQLLDLQHGRILANSIVFNKQISYGVDVIARIAFIQKPGIAGLKKCQQAVVDSINEVIDAVLAQSHVDRNDVGHMALAGNTTMTQILLGLDPKYIRLAPYTPAANFVPPVKAASMGIKLAGHVYVSTFPSISSYVGGDIVAGVIAAGIHQRNKLTFYMDIGTNGEIVIGNADWMVTASCSAGPAFEGGGIKHGMVAISGAIQDFTIDPSSLEPTCRTIADTKPKGICGSGLINIMAVLLEAGVISQNGKFNVGLSSSRIREGEDGYEYVLAWAPETQIGQDIVITEVDIDNLIRAKAAMYAGCHTLSHSVNITCADFEQVILAGNFGSSLDIEKAITIGLLPDIPLDRFTFVGNGSLSGARLVSFSKDLLNDSQKVAQNMTNIELSDNLEFTNNYVAALFLPHTDDRAFPSVNGRIKRTIKARTGGSG